MRRLETVLEGLADRARCIFSFDDLQGALPEYGELPVLLSRAVKTGRLRRVCRGIYLYPRADCTAGLILFHAAARLRANEFNYISLETALSDAGVISQIPINWITLMSSGRSHLVNCGDFGRIEFVYTARRPESLAGELTYDPDRHLWRASVALALRDMRVTRRRADLIDQEAAHELV